MERHISLIALTSALLFPSTYETKAQPPSEDFTLRSDVRLVLLDVSVKNHDGFSVSGLSRENFTIYEDGHAQPIKVFADSDLPVTVGLLVDASYSMTPKRNEVLNAAMVFIRESNPADELFVLNFNETVRAGLPKGINFSSDRTQLRDALYRGKPMGRTALNDAVIAGLKQLSSGTRDRRTLVVISDGGDNASEHKRAELLSAIEESMATVYTIGLYENGDPDRDPALLRKLANVSGGQAYFPTSRDEMGDVCSRIAKDIRQRYTVGYTPTPPHGDKNELRKIRINVQGPGNSKLTARARTSYRYDHQIQSAKK